MGLPKAQDEMSGLCKVLCFGAFYLDEQHIMYIVWHGTHAALNQSANENAAA